MLSRVSARECLVAAIDTSTHGQGSAPPVVPELDAVAGAFPHLEILGLIGAGGMGAVFKARQPKLNRFVALKILPESPWQ
jgi:serine/threonine protein kinase